MKTKLAILLASFNTKEKTERCLSHLLRHTDTAFHIFIIDNGSTDGSVQMLEDFSTRHEPLCTLLKNEQNIGYAAAMCSAYPFLPPGAHIAYVNSDVYVGPNWASRLLSHFSWHDRIGAVAPLGRMIGGRQDVSARLNGQLSDWPVIGETYSETDLVAINEYAKRAHPKAESTKSLQGTVLLVNRKLHDEIGGLDPNCILGADDADYSLSARMAGYELLVALDVFVWHDNHSSFNQLSAVEGSTLIDRSWTYFNQKWAGRLPALSWEDLMENHEPTSLPPFAYHDYDC